jgi:hypothetical protein
MAASSNKDNLELNYQHVLLAKPLPEDLPIPGKLWAILRATTCWEVWKARNKHYMEHITSLPWSIVRRIWHRLCIYMRVSWQQQLTKNQSKENQQAKSQTCNAETVWEKHRNLDPPTRQTGCTVSPTTTNLKKRAGTKESKETKSRQKVLIRNATSRRPLVVLEAFSGEHAFPCLLR